MTAAAPRPIPGRPLDPAPKEVPELVQRFDDEDSAPGLVAGVAYRAMRRFTSTRATLLAAGTTYYVFLSLFSLVAMAYGVTALLGADQIADYLTRGLMEAFPGLIGEEGIDPNLLKSIGQTSSLIGLLVMLYSGGGAMAAASGSIHLIYGAPLDPRSYVVERARLLAWLMVLGPLIVASLVAGIAMQNFSSQVLDFIGWEGGTEGMLTRLLAVVVTLGVDFFVVFVLLGRLGGIRPHNRPLVIGSVVGAVAIQLLRYAMGMILEFSADKPQYGALTLPIGILLVLYMNTLALLGAAALTAGIADRDAPIEHSAPTRRLAADEPVSTG